MTQNQLQTSTSTASQHQAPITHPDLALRLASSRRRRNRHDLLVVTLLAVVVLGLALVTLMVGSVTYTPAQILTLLTGGEVPGAQFLVMELRLPRALGAVATGMAFGIGGCLFQTLLRNVLASPDVIGISSGASAAAVVAIGLFGVSGLTVTAWSVGGALVTAALIWGLAGRRGDTGLRFVLTGIAVGAALQAVISYVLTRSSTNQAQAAVVWMTGSLSRSLWDQLGPTLPALVVLILAALVLSRRLPVLRLGDETSMSLGVRAGRLRALLIGCAVLLVAAATSLTGPISFVAFLCGPVAARLVRRDSWLTLAAGLVGAALVLAADLIGQQWLSQTVPVGVVTGAVGAPYLLFLLMRGRTRA